MVICRVVRESTKHHDGSPTIRRTVVPIMNVVSLHTLAILSEAKNIVELSVILGLRKVSLMFDSCQDVSVVSLARCLDDVDIDLGLALAPVFDAVPVLEDEPRSAVRFVQGDPAVAFRSIFLVD